LFALSTSLLKDGVQHLDNETLTRPRQLGDALELALQDRSRSALLRLALHVKELFNRHGESLGQRREHRDRYAPPANLEMSYLLLGDAEDFP
jgi:hypothetical protein